MTKHEIEQKIVDLNARQLLAEAKYMDMAKLFIDNEIKNPLRDRIYNKISEHADSVIALKNEIERLNNLLLHDTL